MTASYEAVMSRKWEILAKATGIDYRAFEGEGLAFDYPALMRSVGYDLPAITEIQRAAGVGRTPMLELHRLTQLARSMAPPGKGARILVKDEAANPSGSFKDRRAALAVHEAATRGFKGIIAATSGNYGAAVASRAAARGLDCIILQEVFDSSGVGQPEIIEKGRKCEAYGAEVHQVSVGPELFYLLLLLLEETGFFSASLYSPYAVAGIATLGSELCAQTQEVAGRPPDAVVVTHAGGGNVSGTALGLQYAGCNATVVAASVDLSGLHMASDTDFNRKSFTTGHTGFGVPFAMNPDRVDVPRNAARPLRFIDRYLLVSQGEVFYMTELLARLEGLERGPAGNTSLAAAVALATEMDEEQVIVVQETEYTGAGKHPNAQLAFARQHGIRIQRGDPASEVPGTSIVIPQVPEQIRTRDLDLDGVRRSYLRNLARDDRSRTLTAPELEFLAAETRWSASRVREEWATVCASLATSA
jgi:2-amino-4-ketopentanoate thiolase beta subunit